MSIQGQLTTSWIKLKEILYFTLSLLVDRLICIKWQIYVKCINA